MKKLIATIIGLILIAPFSFAYYEQVLNLNVISDKKITRNFVVEYDGKQYVLHYNGNCSDAVKNNRLTVNIRSELDGIGDKIIKNSYTECEVDQAEIITGTLDVDWIHGLRAFATVTDANGDKYDVSYSSQCLDMKRYENSYVYLRQFSSTLRKGDIVYLPRKEGVCPLLYVDKIEYEDEEEIDESKDIKVPNKVYNVTAIPGNGEVYLSWRQAYDNVGIDHYIISYSPYSLNTKEYDAKDMPNQIVTTETSYRVTDLRNDETYYFYIIAVDTSGNFGTLWSYESRAMTRSSISESPSTPPTDLKIVKIQETPLSFLFSWDKIPGGIKQNVYLTANGQSEFGLHDWSKDYIRVLKKDSRKGKKLILEVRVYDGRDLWHTDEIEFSF